MNYKEKTWISLILIMLAQLFTNCDTIDPSEPGNLVPKTVND